MRLTPEQIQAIRTGVAEVAGRDARVWLFGSRVHNQTRGRDVVPPALTARLEFSSRVTQKECAYLLDTDRRLFGNLFDLAVLSSALRSCHVFVPTLVATTSRLVAEAKRILQLPASN